MLKKILGSKILKLIFSVVLIYFAFKKVNIMKLFEEIKKVPLWFVLINILISFFTLSTISLRWSLLLFSKLKIKNVLIFIRANFLATFYSLFFPTVVAGEVLKWMVIDKEYPGTPRTKVLGSIILDRFIGFSVLVFLGLISAIVGEQMGLVIPTFVFGLLIVLFVVFLLIYFVIYYFDVFKLLPNIHFLHKLDDAFDLFKNRNKGQILKCLLISLVGEVAWILQIWFISLQFGTNLGILAIFVFIPIISIILILPISIGGFGAREQLYLLFFSQVGSSNESILLMSTFLGILGVIMALFGGFLSLYNKEIKETLGRRPQQLRGKS